MVRDGEMSRLHLEEKWREKSQCMVPFMSRRHVPHGARWMDNGHVFLVDGMGCFFLQNASQGKKETAA